MSEYVNKEEFLNDIIAYKERKKSNPDEPIPNYSANAIMQIASKMANRPNFIGYSYRQDMISDGVYVCLKYFDKFDPVRSEKNPFGYFSRCIWFAFLQRIAKEKKQSEIRGKLLSKMAFETFSLQDIDNDEEFKNSFTEFLRDNNYEVHGIDVKPSAVEITRPSENDAIIAMLEEVDDPDSKDLTYSESEGIEFLEGEIEKGKFDI